MTDKEKKQLRDALMENSTNERAILMDRKTTSFVGSEGDEVPDDVVIAQIRSVPTHY